MISILPELFSSLRIVVPTTIRQAGSEGVSVPAIHVVHVAQHMPKATWELRSQTLAPPATTRGPAPRLRLFWATDHSASIQWTRSAAAPRVSTCRRAESTELRFERLARTWRESRTLPRSATKMAMHPAYQEIIGMGRDALPLILNALQHEVDHWFWALRSIAGIDPVRPEHRGDLHAMASDWIGWAKDQGIL
jgi:hypothetical protein